MFRINVPGKLVTISFMASFYPDAGDLIPPVDEIPPVPSLLSTGPVRLFHHVLLVVALGAAIRTLLHQASGLHENCTRSPATNMESSTRRGYDMNHGKYGDINGEIIYDNMI